MFRASVKPGGGRMNQLLAHSTGILSLAVAGFWGVAQNPTSLEVVVSGISTITKARWRVPVEN
ncbi:MAG: hypothetical protein C4333_00670 [Meiothermus sp.]